MIRTVILALCFAYAVAVDEADKTATPTVADQTAAPTPAVAGTRAVFPSTRNVASSYRFATGAYPTVGSPYSMPAYSMQAGVPQLSTRFAPASQSLPLSMRAAPSLVSVPQVQARPTQVRTGPVVASNVVTPQVLPQVQVRPTQVRTVPVAASNVVRNVTRQASLPTAVASNRNIFAGQTARFLPTTASMLPVGTGNVFGPTTRFATGSLPAPVAGGRFVTGSLPAPVAGGAFRPVGFNFPTTSLPAPVAGGAIGTNNGFVNPGFRFPTSGPGFGSTVPGSILGPRPTGPRPTILRPRPTGPVPTTTPAAPAASVGAPAPSIGVSAPAAVAVATGITPEVPDFGGR